MLRSLTLDDQTGTPVVLHSENGLRQATSVRGLVGIGSPRESRRVRPQTHGGIDNTRHEDGRLIVIEAECSGATLEAAYAEFRAVLAPMIATWDDGPALLKWSEGSSGLSLQRLVRLASEVDPPLEEGAALLKYQAQFYAEDPRAYTQTLTDTYGDVLSAAAGGMVLPDPFTIMFASSGGGLVTFTNTGTRRAPLTFRIHGLCVNPQIILLETGERIAINGTIPAGAYLEVDTYSHSLRMGGTVPQPGMLDSANTTWPLAPVGLSNWQLLAASFDASSRPELLGRSAY